MATVTQDFTTDDIDYVVHGDTPLKLRLFKPAGAGHFPVVVDLHLHGFAVGLDAQEAAETDLGSGK